MSVIFGLLGKHWKWALIAGLVIALALSRAGHDRTRATLKAETVRASTNYTRALGWKAASEAWRAAHSREEAQRRTDSAEAAKALQRASETRQQASSNAFDRGAAFGRNSCGVNDATPTVSARPESYGVRDRADDLRAIWSASAYRPR